MGVQMEYDVSPEYAQLSPIISNVGSIMTRLVQSKRYTLNDIYLVRCAMSRAHLPIKNYKRFVTYLTYQLIMETLSIVDELPLSEILSSRPMRADYPILYPQYRGKSTITTYNRNIDAAYHSNNSAASAGSKAGIRA